MSTQKGFEAGEPSSLGLLDRFRIHFGLADMEPVGSEGEAGVLGFDSSVPVPAESVGTTKAASTTPVVSVADIGQKTRAFVDSDFQQVLGAGTPKFAEFLRQKDVLLSSLKSANVPNAEQVALSSALQLSGLTKYDVEQAFAAMRAFQSGLRRDFEAALADKQKQDVETPSSRLAATREQVSRLLEQKAEIERSIARLQETISPAEAAIAEDQRKINLNRQAFDAAHEQIAALLKAMQDSLLAQASK